MSKHSSGGGNRQFISRPLVALALIVILAAASVTAWMRLGDRIDSSSTDEATACVEGAATVPVVADPALAPGLQRIAQTYNATDPVVRDHCVKIEVRPADARATLEGLTAAKWDARTFGPYPGAWIPESSVWSAALQTVRADLMQGPPESIVFSPVRLAVEPELAKAADGRIAWADLPELTFANALGAFGHRDWGSLRMAMPNGPQSDATALAAQAVARATAGRDAGTPLTPADVKTPRVRSAVEQLISAPPRVGDGSIDAAVTSIAEHQNPSSAPVRAVPVTEQRLYGLTREDRTARVTAVAPRGATPTADYPIIRLSGDAVPAHVADAISEFITFVRKPPQAEILTRMGFRGPGPLPAATPTVRFGDYGDLMSTSEPFAAIEISRIVLPAAVG